MNIKRLASFLLMLGLVVSMVPLASAEPNVGITLYVPIEFASACIGHDIVYDVRITNNTTIATTFTISYSSDWAYSGPTVTSVIGIGDYWDFQITVHIPWSAEPGEADDLSLLVGGAGYEAEATITSTAEFIQGWEDYADAPRGAPFSSDVYYDGRIYKIGGWISSSNSAQNWLDIYDVEIDLWSPGAALPEGRYGMDCEAISGKIYCAGGFQDTAKATLYIYNIATNEWSTGTDLPSGRFYYAGATIDGHYYVIGGRTDAYVITASVLVYNPTTNLWDETHAPMSTARRYHSAGVINNKIYVAGGDSGTLLASAEVYDPILNSWTGIAPMPTARVDAADGVYLDRYLILAGGSSIAHGLASNEALAYDAETNTWHWLRDMNRQIFAAEGDSDGINFWVVSGREYDDATYTDSVATTLMNVCAASCPDPVSGIDFSWDPLEAQTNYPVTFLATIESGAGEIDFSWDLGDSGSDQGQSVIHTFTSPDDYTVELTAANCDGTQTDSVSHVVTVMDAPSITRDPSHLDAIQLPDSITSQQLELCNLGDYSLDWTLSETLTRSNELTEQNNLPLVDVTWLSATPLNGSIAADVCTVIDIAFNSGGLSDGDYYANLNISSNDPVAPLIVVPVSLKVAPPTIELAITVGLDDSICGTTDSLIVYPNTSVYYCYTVTNTGGISFNLHDLVDDQLGVLLNDFLLELAPDESYSRIIDPVIINNTVMNTAIWTAHIDSLLAYDSDYAVITVIPEPDVWVFLPTILKRPVP